MDPNVSASEAPRWRWYAGLWLAISYHHLLNSVVICSPVISQNRLLYLKTRIVKQANLTHQAVIRVDHLLLINMTKTPILWWWISVNVRWMWTPSTIEWCNIANNLFDPLPNYVLHWPQQSVDSISYNQSLYITCVALLLVSFTQFIYPKPQCNQKIPQSGTSWPL